MMPSLNSSSRPGLYAWTAVLFIAVWTVLAPTAQAEEKKAASSMKPQSAATIPTVDVNSADAKALAMLPGIGPVLAQRIIEGRPYKNLDDLGKVKGLSKAKLDALKNAVTFGAATPAREPAAASEKSAKAARTAESKAREATAPTAREQAQRATSAALTGAAEHSAGKLAPGAKININKATVEELDTLPGIGPAKAKAIVDYRTQNGSFKTIEDIEKVTGIKGAVFSKLKDYIKVAD